MQDNDPEHTRELCQSYIKSKEEQYVLQMMFRPAQSTDLNPVELGRDELEQKVRAKQTTSPVHLWQLLEESWAELACLLPIFRWKNAKNLWSSDSG